MTYYQITSEERYTIAALRREGFCSAEIARRLGRHRSTISREVTRNSSRSDGCYRPSKAIERTNGRRARSRRNQYFTKADFALVEKKLKADWSPEQISGHLRLHGKLSIIGGTAQALGYALLENAIFRNGVMQNAQFTNYIIPTTLDTPPMNVELVEEPYSRGPFGAKGVGELPFDVPAPAVAAAVFHATGLFIPELPLLPERIARAKRDQTPR